MAEDQLQKVLSPRAILLITLNAVMGTGIFFLPALGAREAGPASLVSWCIIAIFSIGMASIFGELTSMFPNAGGVYEFCKNAFNGFWAFLVGWVTFLTSNVTIAMLIVGAIEYLVPIDVPFAKITIALVFIFVFHAIAYFGMKTSGTMLIAFAFITLLTLFSIMIPGAFSFDLSNFDPFMVFPMSAIFIAAVSIMETFFGWETATFLAGETQNGEKAVPRALIISTIITAIIAVSITAIGLGNIPWQIFGASQTPLNLLATSIYGSKVVIAFSILVYLSLIGSVAGWIVASPRLILSMAEDKLFISQLAKVHPKYSSPYRAIIFQGIFVSILVYVANASYETVLYLLLPLACLQYIAVIASLISLRYRMPEKTRHHKFPLGTPGAIIFIILLIALIGFWFYEVPSAINSVRLASSIIFSGIPIYFLLKVYYDPDAVIKLNDSFAGLAYVTEKFALPRSVRDEILLLLGDVKSKSILEFGCSIGTLTVDLAKRVSKQGKVFATNISAKEIEISRKRVHRRGHEHVTFIHDQHQINRVHPEIPQVDAVVSFGMLTYIQDVKKVLQEMNDVTKDGGKIVLVDWTNFFHVIPDVEWLTNDAAIRQVFKEAGFAITITRKRGLLWDYLYIHGFKTNIKNKDILYI